MADIADGPVAVVRGYQDQHRRAARPVAFEHDFIDLAALELARAAVMARLMLSPGMLTALAARIAVRRRGLASGSPPLRAAMVISLMTLVNIFPRLESRAAFLS